LGGCADLQARVELFVVGGLEGDPFAGLGFESVGGDGEFVIAGEQELDDPDALGVGLDVLLDVGVDVDDLDRSVGNEAALRIQDAAADRGARVLGVENCGRTGQCGQQ